MRSDASQMQTCISVFVLSIYHYTFEAKFVHKRNQVGDSGILFVHDSGLVDNMVQISRPIDFRTFLDLKISHVAN